MAYKKKIKIKPIETEPEREIKVHIEDEIEPVISTEPVIESAARIFPVKITLFKDDKLVIEYPVFTEDELNEAKISAERKGLKLVMR